MSIRFHSLVVVAGTAALFVACENRSAQPVSPSTMESAPPAAAVPAAAAPAVVATPAGLAAKPESQQHLVTMFDACDPETFNAALGDGTCIRSGEAYASPTFSSSSASTVRSARGTLPRRM